MTRIWKDENGGSVWLSKDSDFDITGIVYLFMSAVLEDIVISSVKIDAEAEREKREKSLGNISDSTTIVFYLFSALGMRDRALLEFTAEIADDIADILLDKIGKREAFSRNIPMSIFGKIVEKTERSEWKRAMWNAEFIIDDSDGALRLWVRPKRALDITKPIETIFMSLVESVAIKLRGRSQECDPAIEEKVSMAALSSDFLMALIDRDPEDYESFREGISGSISDLLSALGTDNPEELLNKGVERISRHLQASLENS